MGSTVGGIYYRLDGAPEQDCFVPHDLFADCLLLADDFHLHASDRTIDLEDVRAAKTPQLRTQQSFDTEEAYDHVLVEVHAVGSDDWTTLPEVGGSSRTGVPADCEQGFLLERTRPCALRNPGRGRLHRHRHDG